MLPIKVSFVIAVYRSEGTLELLTEKIIQTIIPLVTSYEIIFVNDGSPDNSWNKLKQLSASNPNIISISLSRNFGQHPAIHCGLKHATGDAIIVMDCDLQEDPAYISQLLSEYEKGYDIVYTFKRSRKHATWKNIAVSIYNRIYNYLIDDKRLLTSKNVGSYSLISNKVKDAFLAYGDYQFHYLLVLRWLGFRHSFVEIEHQYRTIGKSSYNFKRLLEHALVAIVYQSDKLLRLNIYFGIIIALAALLWGIYIIAGYFINGYATGWASIFVMQLFILGSVLFSLGVLGLYIGKMFEQVKNRPRYVIREIINHK